MSVVSGKSKYSAILDETKSVEDGSYVGRVDKEALAVVRCKVQARFASDYLPSQLNLVPAGNICSNATA